MKEKELQQKKYGTNDQFTKIKLIHLRKSWASDAESRNPIYEKIRGPSIDQRGY